MKKLTAGIFTVLLGAVSVNAADAAVASKGYVDQETNKVTFTETNYLNSTTGLKGAATTLDTQIKSVADTVALKANAADVYTIEQADLKFQTLEKAATDAQTAQKYTDSKVQELADTLGGTGEDGESTGLVSTVTALGNRVSTNETAISTLNGGTDTAGSVAHSIANALTDYAKTSYVDAQDAATLQSAKDYTDGLAKNYDAAGAATQALTDAKAYTDTLANGAVKTNTDDIAAINEQLKSVATTEGLAALTTTVEGHTTSITNLQTVADTVTNAETGLAATRTLAQKGVDDAATAQAAADANTAKFADYTTTEDLSILAKSNIPTECSNPTNKCVLTYGTAGFEWEVIERGTDE